MIFRAWKIALLCFLAYVVACVILALVTVGGHIAHGEFQGSLQAPVSLSLLIADWLLFVIGLPLVPIATTGAAIASIHLSALHYILLYATNGICVAYFAKFAYLWLARRKAAGEIPKLP